MSSWESLANEYIEHRRALGAKVINLEMHLRAFTSHLDQIEYRGPLTIKLQVEWLRELKGRDSFHRARKLGSLRSFAKYRSIFESNTEVLVVLMNEIYTQYWLPLQNFFIPNFKLEEKVRIGARIKKRYGPPKTAYERLIESKHLSELRKLRLKKRYEQLDPFVLSAALKSKLSQFSSILKQSKLGAIYDTHSPQSFS